MEHVDKSILERIKKLQAKADSLKAAGPEYEQEALTFAAAVQRMLLQHDLDMSDVEYQLDVDKDPVKLHRFNPDSFGLPRKKREILWEQALAATVANAHQCEIIPIMKTNSFYFIGRRTHRAVAEYMFVYLSKTILSLADKSYTKRFYELRDAGVVQAARGYRASFIEACVSRVIQRYREAREAAVNELTQQQRGVAMIRISQERALIKSMMDKLQKSGFTEYSTTTPMSSNKVNRLGELDGDDAGKTINLNQTGLKGGSTAKEVGPGQKLLGAG